MNYATQQDLVDRFGHDELVQLTDTDNLGDINATVVALALADADAEIDGYLVGRYTTPLATVPAIIVAYACDIARYRLHDDLATEHVRKRYEDAIRFLRSVAAGQVQLGVTDPTAGTIDQSPQVDAPARVFTRDTLEGF